MKPNRLKDRKLSILQELIVLFLAVLALAAFPAASGLGLLTLNDLISP